MGRVIYSGMGGTRVMLEMPDTGQTIADLGLNPTGDVQAFVTRRAAERMDAYVPLRDGPLKNTADYTSDPTEIAYNQEYARFQYYGVVMEDPETHSAWARRGTKKIVRSPTQNLVYHGGAQRGAFWDEKMMANEGEQFFKEIQEYSDRREV